MDGDQRQLPLQVAVPVLLWWLLRLKYQLELSPYQLWRRL